MLKNSNENIEILNYESDKQCYFSLVDDLLLTVQNVVSGIASISKHTINNTYCEFYIHFSATLPLVTLRYELNRTKNENSDMFKLPVDNQLNSHLKFTEYDFEKLISLYNSNILFPVSKLLNCNKERDTFFKSRLLPTYIDKKFNAFDLKGISSEIVKEKKILYRKQPPLYGNFKSSVNADTANTFSELVLNNAETWATNSRLNIENKKSFVENLPSNTLDTNALKHFEAENCNQINDKMDQNAGNEKARRSMYSTYIISDNIVYSSSDSDENSYFEESENYGSSTLEWVNQQPIDDGNEDKQNEEGGFHEVNTLPVMCILNESADENEDLSSNSISISDNLETNKNWEVIKKEKKTSVHGENQGTSITGQSDKIESKVPNNDRPHSCSYCKKTFVHLNHKKQHERTHTGEKPYSCSYCEKKFSQMSSRDRHEKVHTGEKPYLCSYCGKLFNSVGNKNKHEKIHTGERPYNCQFCGKPFISRDKKDLHEKTHSGEKPHQCSFCEKSFTSVRGRQEHEMIHLGKKLYSCRHCKKTFNSASNKSKHEKRHFGKIPYFCHLCNKSFPWPVNKKNHKKECTHSKSEKTNDTNETNKHEGNEKIIKNK